MIANTFPVISVHQPWADLIVDGIKDIENRSWPTTFRGKILIQASKKVDWQVSDPYVQNDLGVKSDDEYHPQTMAIIGMAEITDCVTKHPSRFFRGTYGFILKNPVRFKKPIPYKGQLGVFRVPVALLKGTAAARVTPGDFGT